MNICEDCIHKKVCYRIEHYGEDLEPDGVCEDFEDMDLLKESDEATWMKPSGVLKYFSESYVICSNCNVMLPIIPELDRYEYCPKCGKKMKI